MFQHFILSVSLSLSISVCVRVWAPLYNSAASHVFQPTRRMTFSSFFLFVYSILAHVPNKRAPRPSRSNLVFIRFSDLPFNPLWRWLVLQWQSAIFHVNHPAAAASLPSLLPSSYHLQLCVCSFPPPNRHTFSFDPARPSSQPRRENKPKFVSQGEKSYQTDREETRNRSVIFDRSPWITKSETSPKLRQPPTKKRHHLHK